MRVCCETNFLLELAFWQEQGEACDEILELARTKAIELVIPVFSIFEASEAIDDRHRRRAKVIGDLKDQWKQLARSPLYDLDDKAAERVAEKELLQSLDDERRRFDVSIFHGHASARLIALTADMLRTGAENQQAFGLANRDAIVLACVFADLDEKKTERAYFVSRDRDFLDPRVRAELGRRNCTPFGDYAALVGHLNASPSENT